MIHHRRRWEKRERAREREREGGGGVSHQNSVFTACVGHIGGMAVSGGGGGGGRGAAGGGGEAEGFTCWTSA